MLLPKRIVLKLHIVHSTPLKQDRVRWFWSSSVYRYARRLPFSDSSSDDEQEVPKHYKENVLLPMVPLATLDDFSNNGIVPFVMNARNSYPELIAKTHPIRVEINASWWILINFSNQRIYFQMILVPGTRVKQQ